MKTTDGNPNDSSWPTSKFRFVVDFGNDIKGIFFQEISGMDTETQVVEYRNGNSPAFATVKMPGLKKVSKVTLKKGIFKNDNSFWDFSNNIKMNTIRKQQVIIKLLDEKGNTAMQWTLNNAFPTKITGTDLKSDGNEIAIETLEIAHEGLSIVTNG